MQLIQGVKKKPVVPLFIMLFLFLLGEQFFSKTGVDMAKETVELKAFLVIGLGYCFLICRGLVWLLIMRVVSLSVAYPVQCLSFVLILIMSHVVFGENLPVTKIIGSIFIMVGVGVTSLGK